MKISTVFTICLSVSLSVYLCIQPSIHTWMYAHFVRNTKNKHSAHECLFIQKRVFHASNYAIRLYTDRRTDAVLFSSFVVQRCSRQTWHSFRQRFWSQASKDTSTGHCLRQHKTSPAASGTTSGAKAKTKEAYFTLSTHTGKTTALLPTFM